LVEQAERREARLGREASEVLVERVGLNKWNLESELEKLLLVKKEVTEDDVREVIPASLQAEIFSVLGALAQGKRAEAIEGVSKLLEEGNSEFYVLSMMAYQFKVLFMVRAGIDRGKRQFEVVKETGIKQYAVQKSWEVAKRKPAAFWRAALTRVLATDFAIKQGRVDAKTGVLMLVVGLVAERKGVGGQN
jgi:DNA polymerase-3 subunit delta